MTEPLLTFVESTKIDPGTAKEAGQLAKAFFARRKTLNEREKNAQKAFVRAICSLHQQQHFISDHLEGALTGACPQLPQFRDLSKNVTQVILVGQLIPPSLTELNACLQRHYRNQVEVDSPLGVVLVKYCREKRVERALQSYRSARDEPKHLALMRAHCNILVEHIDATYQEPLLSSFNPRVRLSLQETMSQIKRAHAICSSIAAEAYLVTSIESHLAQMAERLDITIDPKEGYGPLISRIQEIFDSWSDQRRRLLNEEHLCHPLLVQLSAQLAQRFEQIDGEYPYSSYPQDSFDGIDQVRACSSLREWESQVLLEQLAITLASCGGDLAQSLEIERQFYRAASCETLIHDLLCQARCLVLAAERWPATSDEIARATPVFEAIGEFSSHLASDYSEFRSFWLAMVRTPIAILELFASCAELFRRHRDSQSARYLSAIEEREYLMNQRQRLPKDFKEGMKRCAFPLLARNPALPPELAVIFDQSEPWRSTHLNLKASGALAERLKAAKQLADSEGSSQRPLQLEESLALKVATFQPLDEIDDEAGKFLYHSAVSAFPFRYRINLESTANGATEERVNFNQVTEGELALSNRIPLLADYFWHWATAMLQRADQTGTTVSRYALPAEVTLSGNTFRGCLVWTVDGEGRCVHRGFYSKPLDDFIPKYGRRRFEWVDFPLPESLPGQIEIDSGDWGTSIEVFIDALTHVATLRSCDGRPATLRLFLVKIGAT